MVGKARAVGRDVNSNRANMRRFASTTAREVLVDAGFGRNREVLCLTGGDFSLIDWIEALLEYTGPADAVISTWTAAGADVSRVDTWLSSAKLNSCRWLVDRSFVNRQPALCDNLRQRFGDDTIRVYASHAKFVTLSNAAGWRIVSMSSANLNHNARIESFHALDDGDLFAGFADVVASVFAAQAAGTGFDDNATKAAPNKALKLAGAIDKARAAGLRHAHEIPMR